MAICRLSRSQTVFEIGFGRDTGCVAGTVIMFKAHSKLTLKLVKQ